MMADFLLSLLVCPICKGRLIRSGTLRCEPCRSDYAIDDAIPIMLRPELFDNASKSPNWFTERKRYEAMHFSSIADPYIGEITGGGKYLRILNAVEGTWINAWFGSYVFAQIQKHGDSAVDSLR